MKRLCALVLGAVVLAAAQGCTKEPALYLGGPPGPPSQQRISDNDLTVVLGDSVAVGARAEDAVGNRTADAVTLSACDASVSIADVSSDEQWTTTAFIKGAGIGSSCVLAQTAGLTADTIRVVVGPVGVTISGPDTVLSGAGGDYVATFLDADGNPLTGSAPVTWSTSSRGTMVIGASTGGATGVSPGTVFVQAQVAGGANAKKSAVVVAGVYTGSLSSASAAPGELVTATRAADGPFWDSDTGVKLGSVTAFVDYIRPATIGRPDLGANQLLFAVPAIGSTTAAKLAFSNIGGTQLAQNSTFTPTLADVDVYQPGNIDNACGIPGTIPVFETVGSPGGAIYFVHHGSTQGTGSCLDGGDGYDHWFIFTTSASGKTDIVATWLLSGDNDLEVCDVAFTAPCKFGYSGNTLDETMTGVALLPSTQYYVIFQEYAANAGINNIKLKITKY
jgi:hypothetical protein